MCTYLKTMKGLKPKCLKNKYFANIQELFEKAMKRVNTFVDYRTELVEESSKKAGIKLEENLKKAEAKVMEVPDDRDDVTIDATPLSIKSPTIMLKNFDRGNLEVLWSIVKARFKKTEPVNYMDNLLLHHLKTMFEHHDEDNVWKNQQGLVKVLNWKLYDSCRVHCVTVQSIPFYLLVEKIYPLTNYTLHQMFNDVKLQVDYECEMGRIVGIKRLLDDLRVTAAQVQKIENKAKTRVNITYATSAADVAATWASGTQLADMALPHRLTWDLHADVAADVACHVAIGPCFVSTRLGSEPIIGSLVRGFGRYTWHEMVDLAVKSWRTR
ncbi:hypothetical protein Tco_0842029 [Tanacetum coccineum]|uniref:Uncharacterized protein n=1 Tax=Tanacetum coccineum TaxID=301880 RepID=A0ABQ5B0U3_9ASTR